MPEKVVRESAEKTDATANEAYETANKFAEEARKAAEQAYTTASKRATDFNLQLMETAQANTNADSDFAQELSRANSPSEAFELSTEHANKLRENRDKQTEQLTALADEMAKVADSEITQARNADFDFARQLSRAKSPSEAFELSAAHANKQWKNRSKQMEQLTALAYDMAKAAYPIQAERRGRAKVGARDQN